MSRAERPSEQPGIRLQPGLLRISWSLVDGGTAGFGDDSEEARAINARKTQLSEKIRETIVTDAIKKDYKRLKVHFPINYLT